MSIYNEDKILEKMRDEQYDSFQIYNLTNYIPSSKICYYIIKEKLENYVNLICEYYLDHETENCEILEENIKDALYNFIIDNDEIDERQIEIIGLYLESITITDEYVDKINFLIRKTTNDKLKEILNIFIGNDKVLDDLLENMKKINEFNKIKEYEEINKSQCNIL